MNRDSGKAHIARAALESIAYQVRDAVELMLRDSCILLQELHADGGASDNAVLMLFPGRHAGAAGGEIGGNRTFRHGFRLLRRASHRLLVIAEEIAAQARPYRSYMPQIEPGRREKLYAGWRQSVSPVLQYGPQSQADI
nr:FGGY-family carbohydrate kinase [Paenibacillus prosopidis]